MGSSGSPRFQIVDGLALPLHFKKENYYLIKDIAYRQGDIILSTYPKCGTNWTAYIIWSILHPEEDPPSGNSILTGAIPYVESFGLGIWADSKEDQPRTLTTHLPPGRLTIDVGAKYVVVMRNPFDCCVSFYHFYQGLGFIDMKPNGKYVPDVFVDLFVDGKMVYGDFFDHVLKWNELRDEPNVLTVTYEELKDDPKGQILRIARFLGHGDKLELDNCRLLDKVVNQSSFSFMKKNVKYSFKDESGGDKDIPVVRKGQVGSFRDELTEQQILKLRNKMEEALAGTSLLKLWRDL